MALVLKDIFFEQGGVTVLQNLDLELEQGRLYSLLGPSTSGRTSLLRLIAGLDRPRQGKIILDGKDITQVNVRQRNVAMVYEEFINYPHLNVFENIASPLRVKNNLSRREVEQKVLQVASMLKLSPFLKRLPAELSGGQQQRTGLARALIKEADLLLLDNPLANLDYKLREELRSELKDLLAQRKSLVIYSTPDPMEALCLGGQTIIIHEGRILQQGDALAVYQLPQTMKAAQLVSDPPMNFVEGEIRDAHLFMGSHLRVALPAHLSKLAQGKYLIGIRPQHLQAAHAGDGAADEGAWESKVLMVEMNGEETLLHLLWEGSKTILWDRPGVHPLELGTRMKVILPLQNLFAYSLEGHLLCPPICPPKEAGAY